MTCPYASWDGSYVLGALSPADRHEFEGHLEDCPACAAAVRSLAGLPGLMARVDEKELTDPPSHEPVPDTLLPSLVREVRRQRRRRTWVVAGLAAASVVTVTGAAVTVGGLVREEAPAVHPGGATGSSSPAPADAARAMQTIGDAPVAGWLSVESVAWGTRLSLECTYEERGDYSAPGADDYDYDYDYVMVVRTRDGDEQQVATWHSVPGRPIHLEAATATERSDIASVEVRDGSGRAVLRLRG